MNKIIESAIKARSNHRIKKMYKRIEKEERSYNEKASIELLKHYAKTLERFMSEAKSAPTYEEGLYWLGLAKRYSIRFLKIKQKLEKRES